MTGRCKRSLDLFFAGLIQQFLPELAEISRLGRQESRLDALQADADIYVDAVALRQLALKLG